MLFHVEKLKFIKVCVCIQKSTVAGMVYMVATVFKKLTLVQTDIYQNLFQTFDLYSIC